MGKPRTPTDLACLMAFDQAEEIHGEHRSTEYLAAIAGDALGVEPHVIICGMVNTSVTGPEKAKP